MRRLRTDLPFLDAGEANPFPRGENPFLKKQTLTWERAMALIEESTLERVGTELCSSPLVSVSLITYQHRPFIEEAVESILSQDARFPFEIVIGDDGSTDGTAEILEEYQRRYPDKIRLLLANPNLGSHTGNGRLNLIRTLRACRGKYVALLEGDDYWTHPGKLQAQSDCLETNPDYDFCFHNVSVLDASTSRAKPLNRRPLPEPVELHDMIARYIAQTGSYFFRNDFDFFWNTWFVHVTAADNILRYAFVTGEHRAKYIHEAWSVWRKRPGTASERLKQDRYQHLLGRLGALFRLEDETGYDLRAEQQALVEKSIPRLLPELRHPIRMKILLTFLLRQLRLRLRAS